MDNKVKEALANINLVVANVRMTREEHQRLVGDIDLISGICEKAVAKEITKKAD